MKNRKSGTARDGEPRYPVDMDTTLSEASLTRWHVRLGRAADLITARLDDPPSLEELAAAAAVSPFHLHRIWRGLTGETVRQSIARLRIEAVQPTLAAGGSVTDAALAAGFATPQAFARAFRRTTGITPSQGRAVMGMSEAPDSPIRIELRDAVSVVALRRQGGEYVALNALFQAVWDWAEGVGVLEGLSGLYGIPYDDPASVAVDELRYAACLAFEEAPAPPAPLEVIALPAGDHACIRHIGGYDALQPLSQWLVGEWLPRSGREPGAAPLYHHFHNDPESVPEAEWVTDILLPLAPEQENDG